MTINTDAFFALDYKKDNKWIRKSLFINYIFPFEKHINTVINLYHILKTKYFKIGILCRKIIALIICLFLWRDTWPRQLIGSDYLRSQFRRSAYSHHSGVRGSRQTSIVLDKSHRAYGRSRVCKHKAKWEEERKKERGVEEKGKTESSN